MRLVLVASLALNLFVATAWCFYAIHIGGMGRAFRRVPILRTLLGEPSHRDRWIERHKQLPLDEAEIIFAGDSLISGGPWGLLVGGVANLGIPGETMEELVSRLPTTLTVCPRFLVLQAGHNDLASENPDTKEVASALGAYLARVNTSCPQTRVVLLAVWPVRPEIARYPDGIRSKMERIDELNDEYRRVTRGMENVRFIDLEDALSSADGKLRFDYSVDGVHPRPRTYPVILKEMANRLPPDWQELWNISR